MVLLHDNVRPITTARIRALLEHFKWELFDNLLSSCLLYGTLKMVIRTAEKTVLPLPL
jgi:hypothetical protein